MNLPAKTRNGRCDTAVASRFSSLITAHSALFTSSAPFSPSTPFFPTSGPATRSFQRPSHQKQFLSSNLNKAHVQYLESRLVELATKAKRCVLDNGNVPTLPSLAEAEAADAEGFLAEIQLCLPLLGLSVFTPAAASSTRKPMEINTKGIVAKGLPTSEGFVGS